jgi:hypothetical protein
MIQNRNYGSMKTKVGNNVQDTSANFLGLVGGWLNDRYIEVMRRANHIATSRYDFSISATTEDTTLPDDFNDCVSLIDKTNKMKLVQIDFQQWTNGDVSSIDTASTSYNYVLFDDVVKAQPTSASALAFSSSSSADTTQTFYVRGIVNGSEDYETGTLNGTTPVSTTKSFSRIYAIGFDLARTGIVTITANASATTVAVVSREAIQTRYKKLRLVPISNITLDLEMIYTQKAMPMNQVYDYPLLDCEDILEAGATADAWKYKRQNSKADYWENIFEKRLDDWMWSRENKSDMAHFFKPSTYSRNYF